MCVFYSRAGWRQAAERHPRGSIGFGARDDSHSEDDSSSNRNEDGEGGEEEDEEGMWEDDMGEEGVQASPDQGRAEAPRIGFNVEKGVMGASSLW